jgi:hypothetical protein
VYNPGLAIMQVKVLMIKAVMGSYGRKRVLILTDHNKKDGGM